MDNLIDAAKEFATIINVQFLDGHKKKVYENFMKTIAEADAQKPYFPTPAMDNFEQLKELQKKIGYEEGGLELVAVLGLFAEAGDLLEQWYIANRSSVPNDLSTMLHDAVATAKEVKEVNDNIRQQRIVLPEATNATTALVLRELANIFYYVSALAINESVRLDTLAERAVKMADQKVQQNKSTWPKTLDEAIAAVLPRFKRLDLAIKHATDLSGFVAFCESQLTGGIGMQIRNQLGLWGENEALIDHFKTVYGLQHPDDMSAMIIERVFYTIQNDRPRRPRI